MRRPLGVKCFVASGKALSDNRHQRSCRLREPADNANFALSHALMTLRGRCEAVEGKQAVAEKSSQVIQGRGGPQHRSREIGDFRVLVHP